MKTKQPLCPSDVPPGSVFRYPEWNGGFIYPSQVYGDGIVIAETLVDGKEHTINRSYTWERMADEEWQILRPGQDWQPCYKEVEQTVQTRIEHPIDPMDFKPGQIVDIQTARKLHAAGVKLEWRYESVLGKFYPVENPIWTSGLVFRVSMPPGELTAEEAKAAFERGENVQIQMVSGDWVDCTGYVDPSNITYRLKPTPITRDIRPDELPERFEVVYPSALKTTWDRAEVDAARIQKWIEKKARYRTDLTSKETTPFTVTEEPK